MLGQELKQLRENKGLRLEEVGLILGVSNATVCMWEHNSRRPKLSTLIKISKLYNISIEKLIKCYNK